MRFRRFLIAALWILACGLSTAVRADLYWDSNGSAAGGSNSDTATGTWGTDNFWSADLNGLASTGPWVADETAVFSADVNVTGTYDVAVNGTQSASGITFEEGAVTLTGGTVTLANTGTVTVGTGLTATINSAIGGAVGLRTAGSGTLLLGGTGNNYTGNTVLASNADALNPNNLRLGASEVIPNTSIIQIAGLNSVFHLNGQTETVKSISTVGGGPFTGSRIDVGSGTLIIDDDGETQGFPLQVVSGATGKIIKNGDGTLGLSGINSNFTGEFILNAGTLGMNEIRAFGDNVLGSKLTINGGTITSGATRSMRVLNVDIGGDFTFSALNPVQVEFIGATVASEGTTVVTLRSTPNINVPTAGTFLIFRGPVGDDGGDRGIIKSGAGVLTINNPGNTYGGDTTIQGGQVRIDDTSDLGDGTGTLHLSGGSLNTTQNRDPSTEPVPNPINVTADSAITTTQAGNVTLLPSVDLNFTSNSIGGTNGTLTFRNDAAVTVANPSNTFDPRFTGNGFNLSRPIILAAGGVVPASRFTRLNGANATGTQTFSGDISGPGKFRRMTAGGTTTLTGANTYSGGTEVEGGTLNVNGSTATLGTGNVTVTGGILDIDTGVANAIADAATLSISGTGIVNLDGGINDTIAGLILGGTAQTTPGTYGSTASGAAFPNDTFFTGMGRVTLAAMAIAGDFDGDGDVDSTDFNHATLGFKARFGNDLDGGDFLDWQRNFGTNVPPSAPSAAAVPEPASVVLVTLAVAGAFAVRRRARRHA